MKKRRPVRKEKAKEQMPELDEKDHEIIQWMRDKPEIRLKALAESIPIVSGAEEKVPYSTIQKRVNKLKEMGVVKEIYTVNLKKIGYPLRFRIDIVVDPVDLREEKGKGINSQRKLAKYIVEELATEEKYAGRIIVDDVFILLGGQADMSLDIRSSDNEIVSEFVTESLRKTYGIRNTMTVHLTESYMNGKALGFDGHSDMSKNE